MLRHALVPSTTRRSHVRSTRFRECTTHDVLRHLTPPHRRPLDIGSAGFAPTLGVTRTINTATHAHTADSETIKDTCTPQNTFQRVQRRSRSEVLVTAGAQLRSWKPTRTRGSKCMAPRRWQELDPRSGAGGRPSVGVVGTSGHNAPSVNGRLCRRHGES